MKPLPHETPALLTLYLSDSEAAERFGAGERSGAKWQNQVEELAEQAEDCKAELESSFEVPLLENEADFEMLDLLITQGWQESAPSEEELAAIALNWGAYLGALVCEQLGGVWVLRGDPLHHSVRFPRTETQFFPVHAILRSFALGPEGTLQASYESLSESLLL